MQWPLGFFDPSQYARDNFRAHPYDPVDVARKNDVLLTRNLLF